MTYTISHLYIEWSGGTVLYGNVLYFKSLSYCPDISFRDAKLSCTLKIYDHVGHKTFFIENCFEFHDFQLGKKTL